jgi:hypothetical protein
MKRISLALVLLALAPDVSQAHHFYSSSYYNVHYTPYALSYRHSGLVAGGVDYSMYAFDERHSGLIYQYATYAPYAFTYGNTGLVPGYYPYWWPYGVVLPIAVGHPAGRVMRTASAGPVARGGTAVAQAPAAATVPPPADGLMIIRDHLRAQGFNMVSINRVLRIDGKLVGVDFTLPEQKLAIKYWDPKEVESLRSKPAYQQTLYERHKQDWEAYAQRYRQIGGEVYCVEASDPQTIVAALKSYPKLDLGGRDPTRTVMYAKE